MRREGVGNSGVGVATARVVGAIVGVNSKSRPSQVSKTVRAETELKGSKSS